MAKIYKFSEFKAAPWYDDGIEAINSLPDELAETIISFVFNYLLIEVKVNLGLLEVENEPDKLLFAEAVDNAYEEAAGGCYFCSKGVDPNEQEFGPNTQLCPICQLKLANYTQALGIDPGKIFPTVRGPRRVQRARIKEKK